MSITNVQTLHDLAETSLASYAYLEVTSNNETLSDKLQKDKIGANFTADQAATFVAKYNLLATQPNVDLNGFSATVFLDKQSGVKVFALRGTEFTQTFGQIVTDFAVADALGIGGSGYANLQGLEMCRYWKRLNTAGGQPVSYTNTELFKLYALKLGPIAGAAALALGPLTVLASAGFQLFANGLQSDVGIDSGVPGQPVIAPGEKVDVTGHSLGGHLALLFSRIFPDSVHEVVTLNAPTFFTQGDLFLDALGYTSTQSAHVTRIEADGDGVHVLGNVSFGAVVSIAQENKLGVIPAFVDNHSSVNGVDAVYLMSVFAKLDTSKAGNAAFLSQLIRASSSNTIASYEKLADALRKALGGPDVVPLPVGDASVLPARTTFYATLTALQNNPIFKDLAGQLNIKLSSSDLGAAARNDFGALIALQDLSPIAISGKDALADAKLAEIWQVGRAADYAAWLADKTATIPSTYTDKWIDDRQRLLQTLIQVNLLNVLPDPDGYMATPGVGGNPDNVRFIDVASGVLLQSTTSHSTPTTAPTEYIIFDNDGAHDVNGGSQNDHLYGGGGNDTIDGKAGDDYIEGNVGNDTLIGGGGNDTLVGGAGTDTYKFSSGFGKDLIVDSDGLGEIKIDGMTLNGGSKRDDGAWYSDIQHILYTLSGTGNNQVLFIQADGSSDTIKVKGWQSGQLGLTLDGAVVVSPPPQPTTVYIGDYVKATNAAGTYLVDGTGNYIKAGNQANTSDILIGSSIADLMQGLGGSDLLIGNGGNDWMEGGDGADILMGGLGADFLYGGEGNDVIYGSGSGSAPMLTSTGQSAPTPTLAYVDAQGFNWFIDSSGYDQEGIWGHFVANEVDRFTLTGDQGNYIEAGGGNDGVLAGTGNDKVYGGTGSDEIWGMAGDDKLYGDDGNDRIYGDGTVAAGYLYTTASGQHGKDMLFGGAGNDILIGQGGDDELFGGDDNDKLWGDDRDTDSTPETANGKDYLDGGKGNDDLVGGGGDDVLFGGEGVDRLWGDGGSVDVGSAGYLEALYQGNDYLDGGAGNDYLQGEGGDDILFGGADDDTMLGDDHQSRLDGQFHGDDYMNGEAGNDQMEGGGGDDTMWGGTGNDVLFGDDATIDVQYHGDDYLYGEKGNDTLFGDGGEDYLDGGEDNDYLDGGKGDDTLVGGSGQNTLLGGEGNDTLISDGQDYLDGGAGNDVYSISLGAATAVVDDGEGTNTINLVGGSSKLTDYRVVSSEGRALLVVDGLGMVGLGDKVDFTQTFVKIAGQDYSLAQIIAQEDPANLIHSVSVSMTGEITNTSTATAPVFLAGSIRADALDGGAAADVLQGGGGNDVLTGGGGNDYLDGGSGSDIYRFGLNGGHDTIHETSGATQDIDAIAFAPGINPSDVTVTSNGLDVVFTLNSTQDSVTVSNFFQVGANTLERVTFADGTQWDATFIRTLLLVGTDGNDSLHGGDLNDVIAGLGGNDQISGANGDDQLSGDDGNDYLQGDNGNDVLFGGAGNDTIGGGSGTNILMGGEGDDFLGGYAPGGAGDFLMGGIGNDTLNGDAGADTYYFRRGDGNDTIYDFDQSSPGSDVLIFGPEITASDLILTRVGEDLVISLAGTTDSVKIGQWFTQTSYRIETLLFADGTQWSGADIELKVVTVGTDLADTLIANSGNNTVAGLGGNDFITTGAGDDVLEGGAGNDGLDAYGGNDTLVGGSGDDILQGGSGSDVYVFNTGDGMDSIFDARYDGDPRYNPTRRPGEIDTIRLNMLPANVVLTRGGYANASLMVGMPDGDRIEVSGWFAQDDTSGTLQIVFANGVVWDAETLRSLSASLASAGSDCLYGGAADDLLEGLGGNDLIRGGAGNDTLVGGSGDDELRGGAGSDTYVFGYGAGRDVISENDWSATGNTSIDTIRFAPGVSAQNVVVTRNGSWVVVSLKNSTDQISWYESGERGRIEQLLFDDGTVWNLVQNPAGPMVGTSGNDTLYGSVYDDLISGGAGNDYLAGGTGNDTLLGGNGNDQLVENSGSGSNRLDGGAGNDSIWSNSANDTVVFGYGYGVDTFYRSNVRGTIEFNAGVSPANIQVVGISDRGLQIQLQGSSDRLILSYWFTTNASDETVDAFVFADGTRWNLQDILSHISSTGTASVDYLYGTAAGDTLSGLGGNDVLSGFGGDDHLSGGDGNDVLDGAEGSDMLDGGKGDDQLSGGLGGDTYFFSAGFGRDVINDSANPHVPGSENRIVFGAGISAQSIVVTGDIPTKVPRNLYLSVSGTGDVITLSGWFDKGQSTVDFVEFSDGTIWSRSKLVAMYYASAPGGIMIGTDAADVLVGAASADELWGGAGNDTLTGGGGNDQLYGGIGDDTYVFESGFGSDLIMDLDRVNGHDRIVFGAGIAPEDLIVTRDQANIYLSFANSSDKLTIRWYADESMQIEELWFSNGTVWTAAQLGQMADAAVSVQGTSGADTLLGDANPNLIFGYGGDDILIGLTGDDVLDGGAGDDRLDGGSGDDMLSGGAGNDTYIGGIGNDTMSDTSTSSGDTYVWGRGQGRDTIQDQGGNDQVLVSAGVTADQLWFSQSGNDLKVRVIGTTNELVIQGWYVDPTKRLESIKTSDGKTLLSTDVQNLVDAMAQLPFPVNAMTLPPGLQSALAPVFAANWLGAGGVTTNHAPIVALPINDTQAWEDEQFGFTLPAGTFIDQDWDSMTLTVSMSNGSPLPGWLSFDAATMTFSGTPGNADVGIVGVQVTATDKAGATAAATFNVSIANTNDAPVIGDPLMAQAISEGSPWSFTVPAGAFTDADVDDSLYYIATQGDGNDLPEWLVFDPETRTFSGTPPNGNAGIFNLQVIAIDAFGAAAVSSFNLTVFNPNHAPVLAQNPGNQLAVETQSFSFVLPADTFSDVDGDSLMLKVTLAGGAGLPAWLSFDATTRTLTGTPPMATAGALAIEITATDPGGASALTGFQLDIAHIINGTAAANNLIGTAGRDAIYGLAGNDTLNGGAGADVLVGGAGNDTYVVDNAADKVIELLAEGTDTVQSSVSYTLGDNVENLTLTGTAAINGTGNFLNNTLLGNAAVNILSAGDGNDTLNGGAGADTLIGGLGNDIYVVDDGGDQVIEVAGEGTDTVQSSIGYALGSNLENLTLTGSAAINGMGNALNNSLIGNAAANTLGGGDGNDVLNGGAGADTLTGGLGNDTYVVDNAADQVIELAAEGTDTVQAGVSYALSANVENLILTGAQALTGTGNSLNNVLTGNAAGSTLWGLDGNDSLGGGIGADTLIGGTGNDTYTVNHAGDHVVELAGEGTDLVNASVNCTLTSDVENLTLTGTAAISGTGNVLDNILTGNAGANTLSGGAGNDTLNGGAGADTLIGGLGNDTYVADNLADSVIEAAGEGIDTVNASVNYSLAANVENLTLTGTAALNGTGNAQDNVLKGNSAANALNAGDGDDTLDGGTGADTLIGGLGNDLYVVDNAGDIVTENASEGLDTVNASVSHTLAANVENLTLTGTSGLSGAGNALDNLLTGNAGANTLTGNAGDDHLDGKAGNDTLVGGIGNDTYFLGRSYGSDTIQENDATAGNHDLALFDTGISTDQLWFRKVNNNLEISVIGTTDKFTVSNWYLGNQYHVEEFKTSDGAVLLDSQVQNLVQAMASFSPPPAGQTTLSAPYQSALAPVLAANWH
jgi:Ca2+-binding RTX toxin-like protein